MDGHKQGPWGVGWRWRCWARLQPRGSGRPWWWWWRWRWRWRWWGRSDCWARPRHLLTGHFRYGFHTLHYSFSSSDARHSKYSFPVFFPIFFFYIILIFFPWFSVACTLLTPFLSSSTPLTHSNDFLSSRYSFVPLYSGGGASQACPHVLMPHIQKITLGAVQI